MENKDFTMNGFSLWDMPVYLHRQNPIPLDGTSVYTNYEDAAKYAAEDVTAYPGQIIAVVTDDDVKLYKINNKELEEIGKGTLVVSKYSEATAAATAYNVGQIIYVTEDETVGEGDDAVTYAKGPYIVTAADTVAKLGTTSASGDLAADVVKLQGEVNKLEGAATVEGSVASAYNYADVAYNYAGDVYTYASETVGAQADSAYSYAETVGAQADAAYNWASEVYTYASETVGAQADSAYSYADELGGKVDAAQTRADNAYSYAEELGGKVDAAQTRADNAYTWASEVYTYAKETVGAKADSAYSYAEAVGAVADAAKAEAETISLVKSTTNSSYAAVYTFTNAKGNTVDINIPKDLVVKEGSVINAYKSGDTISETKPTEGTDYSSIKALKLVIANQEDAPIYVDVNDLVDKFDGSSITVAQLMDGETEIIPEGESLNSALSDVYTAAKNYADTQDGTYKDLAYAYTGQEVAAEHEYAYAYVGQEVASEHAYAYAEASAQADEAEAAAKQYADTEDTAYLALAYAEAASKANAAETNAKNYADAEDTAYLALAYAEALSKANAAETNAKNYADAEDTAYLKLAYDYVDSQSGGAKDLAYAYTAQEVAAEHAYAYTYVGQEVAAEHELAYAEASAQADEAEAAAKQYADQQDSAYLQKAKDYADAEDTAYLKLAYDYVDDFKNREDGFATAAQGALADSAVQSIAAGTDGSYFSTNVEYTGTSYSISGSVTTVKLADAVGLTYTEGTGWTNASGAVASDGLVTASDVAAEMVADEQVVAAALNKHESRIEALENADAVHTTVNSKTEGHVTVSTDSDKKVTISENDIASAALLGSYSDTATSNTAFGYINALSDAMIYYNEVDLSTEDFPNLD